MMPDLQNTPRLKLALFGTALLTLLLAAWRTVCLLAFFDKEIGYFASGAALVVLRILEWLALALLIALPFLIKKESPAPLREATTPSLVCSAICALLLIVCAIYLAINGNKMPAPALVVILAAACSFLGAVYFAAPLVEKLRGTTAVLFGYLLILAAALLLIITYLDRYTQMNAPHKLSLHLALITVMLGLLFEHRALLSRPKPILHVVATLLAFLTCTAVGLSNTVAFLAGTYDSALYLLLDLLCLGFGAYFGARSFELCSPIPASEEENA